MIPSLAALAVLVAFTAGRNAPARIRLLRAPPGTNAGRARRRRGRAPAPHHDRWPDVLELVVLAVRAGHLPLAALDLVSRRVDEPHSSAFAEVVAATAGGARFCDALAALRTSLGPQAVPFADQLAAADRDGLPLAPVLERLADDARAARRRRAEARARELPVRLSVPLVLCTLPSFVLLAIAPLLLAAVAELRR